MSSREQDFAWRMTRDYGPELCRKTRRERVTLLEQEIAALEQECINELNEHKANCDECRTGEFCLDAYSLSPAQQERQDKINRRRRYVAAEKFDEEYAQKARIHPVVYEHHIDGFCSYWQNVRHRLFEIANYCCQRCGMCGPLEAHHRHYDTLGFEEIADLEALCRKCHKSADHTRAYYAGLATYAEKKYGEYWEESQGIECVEEEFDRWLEAREGRDSEELDYRDEE